MLSKTLVRFCKYYIKIGKKNPIDIILESSPYYPTLLSVIHTLKCVGIEAFAVKCDIQYLKDINIPFLLHVVIKGEERIILARWNKLQKNILIYLPKKNIWQIKKASEILCYWDGVVILTRQKPIEQFNIPIKRFIMILTALCLTVLLIIYEGYITAVTFLLIILGLALSLAVFVQERGYASSYMLNKFCYISTHVNCANVYKSQYGKIMGIKLSEISISYFTSQFILGILMIIKSESPIRILETSLIIVIPIFLYSVFSQILINNICLFCMGILSILLIQSIIAFPYFEIHIHYNTILTIYILTIFLVLLFKSLNVFWKNKDVHNETLYKLLKLKRKKYVLLNESLMFDFHNSLAITLESNLAFPKHIVTSFISPSCSNCKLLVKDIFKLIDRRVISFKWQIILGETQVNDKELNEVWISCYLTDPHSFFNNLRKWCIDEYQFRPSSLCKTHHNLVIQYQQYFDKQIKKYKLTSLPRIAINDRILSPIYGGNDILYVIVDDFIKINSTI